MSARVLHLLVMGTLCAALVGCGKGEKLVKVTGKVVKAGQPVTIADRGQSMGVSFHPVDAAGSVAQNKKSYSAAAKEDGTFAVDGENLKGIPVGKYKVAVYLRDSNFRSPTGQGDRFEGKFTLEKTPFVFDIQEPKEVVLDVGSPGASVPAAPGSTQQPGRN